MIKRCTRHPEFTVWCDGTNFKNYTLIIFQYKHAVLQQHRFVSRVLFYTRLDFFVLSVKMYTYLKHSLKVLDLEMWRQLELVADVIAALSGVGHVSGEDQGLVAQGLDTLHNLFRKLAVPVHVQLEPAVAVRGGSNDLFH